MADTSKVIVRNRTKVPKPTLMPGSDAPRDAFAEPKEDKPSPQVLIAERRRERAFSNVATRIADDELHYLRWAWPGCQREFPQDPIMWRVDRFFPYAKCGPFYVDEPRNEVEVRRCLEKADVMRRLGHSYLFVLPEMTDAEAIAQMRGEPLPPKPEPRFKEVGDHVLDYQRS